MAENTSIEWCDATFNPWTGCTKVSPGCDACETVSHCSRHGCIPVQIERTGGNQGRDDPRSAPADRARLRALAPWLVAAAVTLILWSIA